MILQKERYHQSAFWMAEGVCSVMQSNSPVFLRCLQFGVSRVKFAYLQLRMRSPVAAAIWLWSCQICIRTVLEYKYQGSTNIWSYSP